MPISRIEAHYATDRRCYYGAPSSDLQRELDSQDAMRKHLASLGFRPVWFPNGSFYVGFMESPDGTSHIVTPEVYSLEVCYNYIIDLLENPDVGFPFHHLQRRLSC